MVEKLYQKDLEKALAEHNKIDKWWSSLNLMEKKAVKILIEKLEQGETIQGRKTVKAKEDGPPPPLANVIPMEDGGGPPI